MKVSAPLVLVLFLMAAAVPAGGPLEPSILRVRVTRQNYDSIRPWQKQAPELVGGLGVVLAPDRILVPGGLLANATLVEVERIGDGSRCEAVVECADYAANLGLIRPLDEDFARSLKPVRVGGLAKRGDRVSTVQFEANGTPRTSEGTVVATEMGLPPGARGSFLVYRVSIDLALGNTGITPFFRRGRLIGLMVGYDSSARTAILIPSPVIRHFLDDLADGSYGGFPVAGFLTATIRDPQFRRYLGMGSGDPGVYVAQVLPGGPAAKAGLQAGDVLVRLDRFTIDRHGQYEDPDYGPIALSHLISTRRQVGDKISCLVFRDGGNVELTMTLDRMPVEQFPVPPYEIDRPPRFAIVGGFIFQQLTGQIFSIWGDDWQSKAPRRLTRLEREQWETRQPGEQIIILTRTLPTPENIGYENLAFLPVETVNGKPVRQMADLVQAIRNAGPVEYHQVSFAESDTPDLFIPAATLDLADRFVRERYGIPRLSQLD